MDWSSERYVRFYCRDTVEWKMLPWESRALWPNLLRRLDRAGILPLGKHGVRGLAALVDLPIEVVEPGLQGLLEDGCLLLQGEVLVVPNFIDAQESSQSDRMRKEESRARRRDLANAVTAGHIPSRAVTKRDQESQNVTDGHETGQNVTVGHERSQSVTPCRAVPCRTEDPPLPPLPGGGLPDALPPEAPPPARPKRKPRAMTPDAERIRALIVETTGAKPHPPSAFDKLLRAFETEALTLAQAEAMVGYLGSSACDGYWRKRGMPPQYVFAPAHVAEILPLAEGWRAGTLRTQHKPSAPNPYRVVND